MDTDAGAASSARSAEFTPMDGGGGFGLGVPLTVGVVGILAVGVVGSGGCGGCSKPLQAAGKASVGCKAWAKKTNASRLSRRPPPAARRLLSLRHKRCVHACTRGGQGSNLPWQPWSGETRRRRRRLLLFRGRRGVTRSPTRAPAQGLRAGSAQRTAHSDWGRLCALRTAHTPRWQERPAARTRLQVAAPLCSLALAPARARAWARSLRAAAAR